MAPKDDAQRARCLEMGVDPNKVMTSEDLAPGENIVFLASGVTNGELLDGVRFFSTGVRVCSLVMNYQSKAIRFIDSIHLEKRGSVPVYKM